MNKYKEIQDLSLLRMSICRDCPSFYRSTATCLECGCFMKIKTLLKSSKCPLDKWEALKDA